MNKHKLSEPTKYEMPMPMNDEKPWKQLIKHVERLDDTVTRLVLENAKQAKQLKNHERVWDRIDKDVQLFGNKVVGYGLKQENEDD